MAFVKADLRYHKSEHQDRRKLFFADLATFLETRKFEFSDEKMQKNLVDVYTKKPVIPAPALSDQNKKIFKKIAHETHPDKNKGAEKTKLFLEAKEAVKEGDWFSLYEICSELEIEVPDISESQILWMEQEIEKIQLMIKKITSTIEWIYSDQGANKDHLLTSYCMATCIVRGE